ncbi:acyl-CoA N-acyltransferase [Biscogniauxia marginata]|nr:acyl-CoA N-acyltransferase [Biscogniauxia marginata]
MPNKELIHEPPLGFHVREATLEDVDDLTRLWYASFNPSHAFWNITTPDDAVTRQWWHDAWVMGIRAGSSVLRTFVVEDLTRNKQLVAFSRWNAPQTDGKQDIPLPDYPLDWDPELTEALWEGMPRNRASVMAKKPHWMLEFLGVDQAYQRKGLGFTLVDWGCRKADEAGLEVYLDATIKGLPFYKKYFGFRERQALVMPVRPNTFGTYKLIAVVRPVTQGLILDTKEKHIVECIALDIEV